MFHKLLIFPYLQLRMKIYDLLDSSSTLALSLTNRNILSDVERLKGLGVSLNRNHSSFKIDTILQGAKSLRVINFLQPLPTLAYPGTIKNKIILLRTMKSYYYLFLDLLKELIISGRVVDPLSVNDLLRMTSQLQVLRLENIRLARLNKTRFLQNATCPT